MEKMLSSIYFNLDICNLDIVSYKFIENIFWAEFVHIGGNTFNNKSFKVLSIL